MTHKEQVKDSELVEWMTRVAGDDAGSLVGALISASATYDHIVDGDTYSKGEVHQMVMDLLVTIPQNRIWSTAPVVFQTLFFNAVSAWLHADVDKSYRLKVSDGLSEIGCAILQAKGGLGLLLDAGGEWRRLCVELLNASDERI